MGALPRPALAPGPHRELVDALHSLHHRAGWPSLRQLAAQTGVSHTTVSKVLSSPALPSWGVVELLVEAMAGDVSRVHELWLAASSPATTARPELRVAGRREELAAVRRHVESGSGLLLVTGEAGIGKSTVVEAAVARVDAFLAVGHCLPLSREMPLMPVVDALRVVHRLDGGQWLDEALALCPDFVRRSVARLLPELEQEADALPPDDPWGMERLFASITSTLRALATIRPLVVLLEDCHWADRSTLDLLTQVASVPCEVPVVITWRTGDPDVSSAHSAWLSRSRWTPTTTTVDLVPLTLQETTEQLRLLMGGGGTDEALAARIQARTHGLPLYTAQLAACPDDEGLPPHLADLLDRRIGDLEDEAWQVARVLGLAQRRIGPHTLREATGLAPGTVDHALRVLAGRRLLRSSSEDGAELAHPLLVEAIERRLVPGEAEEVHARLAEALGDQPGVQPGEVADHWRAAGRPDREVAHRTAAARRADAHFAHQQALAAWLRVLELWDTGHRDVGLDLWEVLVRGLDAAIEAGELDVGRALAERAESLHLPDRQRAQVLRRIGSLMFERGQLARAEALLDESLRLLEQLPASRDLPLLLEERFWTYLQSGRDDEAQATLARLLVLLEAHEDADPGLRRRTLAGLTWLTMYRTGDVDASLAIAERAFETELPEPQPIADLMIAACATDILLHVRPSAARAEQVAGPALREAEDWSLEHCFPAVLVRGNLCGLHLMGGDTRAAGEWIRPITGSGPGINTAFAHVMLAAVELREGDLGAALERCRSAQAHIPKRDANWAETVPWIAEVELWAGRPETASELLLEALDSRLTSRTAGQAVPLLVLLARARADLVESSGPGAARRRSAARKLRDLASEGAVDPFASDRFHIAVPALKATWEAELARVEATGSVQTWVRAAAAWDDVARPHDAAYCRWRAAQCALVQGQGSIAARLLKRASTDAHQHVPLREAIAATARAA